MQSFLNIRMLTDFLSAFSWSFFIGLLFSFSVDSAKIIYYFLNPIGTFTFCSLSLLAHSLHSVFTIHYVKQLIGENIQRFWILFKGCMPCIWIYKDQKNWILGNCVKIVFSAVSVEWRTFHEWRPFESIILYTCWMLAHLFRECTMYVKPYSNRV